VARVQIAADWQENVSACWQEFADERLGPDIADDARRYCPVDTGALKASIEHHMEADDLIISAIGGGEDDDGNLYLFRRPGRLSETAALHTHPNPGRNVGSLTTREVHHIAEEGPETGHAYATFVELGHRVFHPSTRIVGPEAVPEQPFLRPALYQERGEGT
jgi:hypothetical protein